VKGERKELIV